MLPVDGVRVRVSLNAQRRRQVEYWGDPVSVQASKWTQAYKHTQHGQIL